MPIVHSLSMIDGVEGALELQPHDECRIVRPMTMSFFLHCELASVLHDVDMLTDEELKDRDRVMRGAKYARILVPDLDLENSDYKVDLAPYESEGLMFLRTRRVIQYRGDGRLLAVYPEAYEGSFPNADIREGHLILWTDEALPKHCDDREGPAKVEAGVEQMVEMLDAQIEPVEHFNDALVSVFEKALANREKGILNLPLLCASDF